MRILFELDLSLAKTSLCVVEGDVEVLFQGKVPREPEPLLERLAGWADDIALAGVEACSLSEWHH